MVVPSPLPTYIFLAFLLGLLITPIVSLLLIWLYTAKVQKLMSTSNNSFLIANDNRNIGFRRLIFSIASIFRGALMYKTKEMKGDLSVDSSLPDSDIKMLNSLVPSSSPLPRWLDLKDAENHFCIRLFVLNLIIGATAAFLYFLGNSISLMPIKYIYTTLAFSSISLLLQMQLLRWSLWRQFLACFIWMGAVTLYYLIFSRDHSTTQVIDYLWLISQSFIIPMISVTILLGIPSQRRINPYVYLALLPLLLLMLMGFVSLHWMLYDQNIIRMPVTLLITLLLLPILIHQRHRIRFALVQAYNRGTFSDLDVLLWAGWFISLSIQIFPGLNSSKSIFPALPILALLCLFLRNKIIRTSVPPSASTTLLVLRVFRHDNSMGWLFDHVVQRWRVLGPVLMISGIDDANRSIDPQELSAFMTGQLEHLYVKQAKDLNYFLEHLRLKPDGSGRYKTNKLHCCDDSWKESMLSLLQRSDTVLMDLRGFSEANQGCQYELAAIGAARHLHAVLFLYDRNTDQEKVQEILDEYGITARQVWHSTEKRVRFDGNVLFKSFLNVSTTNRTTEMKVG